eukprot:1160813-Pelagomonas_calceolata.AAC.12
MSLVSWREGLREMHVKGQSDCAQKKILAWHAYLSTAPGLLSGPSLLKNNDLGRRQKERSPALVSLHSIRILQCSD